MRRLWLPLAVVAFAATSPALAQPAPDAPRRYETRPGDTCASVARRFYGDSRATALIHQANPAMGAPPHHLRPGTVLVIPARPSAADAPDALLTAVHNAVAVLAPAPRQGRPNDPLYRGMRVDTQERSAAEVTFADETQLRMEERTLVVILGETSTRVRRGASAGDTVLERGALTAFLAGLDRARGAAAPPIQTPAARVAVRRSPDGARVRLEVDERARTTVAVYRGASEVSARRQRVPVPQGYGVRATRGAPIPPPRPLPLAPAWRAAPPRVLLADRDVVALVGEYAPGVGGPEGAPPPARWRVEVARDARFNETIADARGPAERTRLEIPDVGPGTWHVRVSAIDAEGFQGPPGEAVAVTVARVELVPAPSTTGRRATVRVPPGLWCGLDGAALAEVTAPLEVDRLRPHVLRCAAGASGEGAAEFPMAAERLGPLAVTASLEGADARARRATARLRVVDARGVPVERPRLRVEPVTAGRVALGDATPADPGVYLVPVTWSPGAGELALRVAVDDERADAPPLALPADVPPAAPAPSERWHHRLSLRVEGAAGYVLSDYQRNTDRASALYQGLAPALSWSAGGGAMAGVELLRPPGGHGGPSLALQVAANFQALPAGEGSTLVGSLVTFWILGGGLRIEPFPWRSRLFVDAHGGAAFSGRVVAPGFDVGLGVDFPLGRAAAIGPYVRYLHLVESGGRAIDEDARVLTGGVAFTLHPASPLAR